jgi:hypothetical protein
VTLPVGIPGRVPVPVQARRLVTGIVAMGTSITDSGGLYNLLDAALAPPMTDLSVGASPINVAGDPGCFRGQVDTALSLSGYNYNCAILDGDSPAASLLIQGLPAQECADQYGAQLDRLLAVGWLVIAQYRGVGVSDTVSFGPQLRAPMAAMYAARPRVKVFDVWAAGDRSDDPTHVIPGTGGHTVGHMYSDPLPTMDHYSAYGAGLVSAGILDVFNRYARTS